MSRLEDKRFLTGTGRYAADLEFADCLQACLLRSPHGHAKIVAVEVEEARVSPEVAGVYTVRTCKRRVSARCPMTPAPRNRDGTGLHPPAWRLLALDTVRYVGDPVALVVAETEQAALDALEKIVVEYQPLSVNVSVSDGRDPMCRLGDRRSPAAPRRLLSTLPSRFPLTWSTTGW